MGEPDIDLYADDLDAEFNDEPPEYGHEANLDLYEDVIAPSDDRNESKVIDSPRQLPSGSRRIPVCVGNLTWWTTDKDLIDAISNIGVEDVADIKFHENRANGQSKGYCIVFVTNENSVKIISDKLPRKEIHGHTPIVTPYNKYNLNYFELQSKKGSGGGRYENSDRRIFREKEWEPHEILRGAGQDRLRRGNSMTSYHSPMQRNPPGPQQMQHPPPQPSPASYQPGHPWIPPPQISSIPPPSARPLAPPTANTSVPPPPPGLQGPPPPIRPGIPPPANVRVPPPRGPPPPIGPRGSVPIPDTRAPPPTLHPEWERQPPPHVGPPPMQQQIGLPNRNMPPMSGPGQGLPSTSGPPPSHVPAPHVNPAFLQHQPAVPVTSQLSSQPSDVYNRPQYPDYHERSTESVSSSGEAEFDEIMARNRSVSSSAISRAVADASVGDYASAIETLVTAISLIKQSKVSNDERCKILISSLQDTLHGIESKSYGSRSKERARSRERDRSRERSSRREKSSRRDRSRSRDRDYRDRSRERDRYHEDRYKDRDHDRERRSRH